MNYFENLKKRTIDATQKAIDAGEKIWEETIKVPEEVQKQRIEICESCDKLGNLRRCRECGCFMDAKSWLPLSSCPLDKWEPHLIKVQDNK